MSKASTSGTASLQRGHSRLCRRHLWTQFEWKRCAHGSASRCSSLSIGSKQMSHSPSMMGGVDGRAGGVPGGVDGGFTVAVVGPALGANGINTDASARSPVKSWRGGGNGGCLAISAWCCCRSCSCRCWSANACARRYERCSSACRSSSRRCSSACRCSSLACTSRCIRACCA